jgi:SSS family transporter
MNNADYPLYITIIAAYLLLLVAVGFVFRRFNKDTSDYFRAGCRGTWWLIGMSAFMASFSAWTFTGAAGVAFEVGWSVLWIFAAGVLGTLLQFLFLAPWYRQIRAVTFPEVLSLRFDEPTRLFYAATGPLFYGLYGGLQLYGVAIFAAAVFGFDVQYVIVALGLAIVLYCMVGGSWAVSATDFLQALIIIPLTVLAAYYALKLMGGVDGMFSLIRERGLEAQFSPVKPADFHPLGTYTLWWGMANLVNGVVQMCSLSSANRYFRVKDGREARKAALLIMVLALLGPCIWFLPPIAARLFMESAVLASPAAKPVEAAYAVFCMETLPRGMIGVMLVAIFAATISSLDSGLNGTAGVIIRDIYPILCRWLKWRQRTEGELLKRSQWITFALGGTVIGSALYFSGREGKGVFEVLLDITALVAMPMTVPMFMGLWIRRAPNWAAWASCGAAFCVSVLSLFTQRLFGVEWNFQEKSFLILGVGVAGFLLSMPFYSRCTLEYKARVEAFFKLMHTPVDFDREIGGANDFSQLKIVGAFAVVMGLALALLLFVPNTIQDRWAIVAISGTVAGLGGLMVWLGWRSAPRAVSGTQGTKEFRE